MLFYSIYINWFTKTIHDTVVSQKTHKEYARDGTQLAVAK